MNQSKTYTNQLIDQLSPYLLQHAHNPVNWYPWSEEAFQKAKDEDKPVFLSIGYSTCHWCHVMERESFEDLEVAELMNKYYISIKVDREERPDIDALYMSVTQMLTGQGGWPMTVVLTPDKKPFFAGTYFPKHTMRGRIGMLEMLERLNQVWKDDREEVLNSAEEITKSLNQDTENDDYLDIDSTVIFRIKEYFESKFDAQWGGFASKPKFPSPHNLMILLDIHKLLNDQKALEMVTLTLDKMRNGGIFDQIGFGFHRYSTDEKWLLPHFEKMLYDNALLMICYAQAYHVSKKEEYKTTVNQIYSYIKRTMMSDDALFYSAEDADSEGVEGKFYIWKSQEIDEILGERANSFKSYYNIRNQGNFVEENARELNGENILFANSDKDEFAEFYKTNVEDLDLFLEDCRKDLFDYREKRVHPFKDDKILTDWNSLMIGAISIAAKLIDNNEMLDQSVKSIEKLYQKHIIDDKMYHLSRNNQITTSAMLDDYAYFTWALIQVYQSTQNLKYLSLANTFAKKMIREFFDNKNGGFFIESIKNNELIASQKDLYDGAMPSGNSVAYAALCLLWKYTFDNRYAHIIKKNSKYFSNKINQYPYIFTFFVSSWMYNQYKSKELVLVCAENDENYENYKKIAKKIVSKNTFVIIKFENEKSNIEYIDNYKCMETKTTLYECENFTCNQPIVDATIILEKLKQAVE